MTEPCFNMLAYRSFFAALLVTTFSAVTASHAADTKFPKTLEQYEMVRAGLAGDDFGAAKNGATNLAQAVQEEFGGSKAVIDAAQKLAASESIDAAREEFKVISGELAKGVQGQPGLYVMNCPMVKGGVWVQTVPKIANPYMGKQMLECGEIVKK